jgi:hypothetical protein
MARQVVEQVQCDRCKRVELQAPLPTPRTEPTFVARYAGKELVYGDLCSHCRSTIERHLEELSQWERELTQKLGPVLSGNQAPPVSAAPDYSPPKPHSQAATTKKS